ncbi:serine/threonine protein phosphatase [Trypanosoma theileri]|uniref:Serine/threonine protein phosphatase n=1 Tax=Trypanosoma theileri TaxID=67003 RepID=A0A1X0NTU4_9TRYP|nr:serine/threonine protein phosphatase [Trypanosoma theileri]ORC88031.1 serine/threonine protein phosphatase [Trypanosoma theileri]
MDTPSVVLAQLRTLKLSNGARVGDLPSNTVTPSTNVTSTLNVFISEHRHLAATAILKQQHPQRDEERLKRNAARETPSHVVSSDTVSRHNRQSELKSNRALQGTSSSSSNSGPGTGVVGGVSGGGIGHSGGVSSSSNNNNNNNNNNSAGKPNRLRPTPRSQQISEETHSKEGGATTTATATATTTTTTSASSVAQPSNAIEQLLRALPSTSIATVREPIPTPPSVAIVQPNVEPDAVRMTTVVAGDAANPKLLEPIDNLNAHRPIIRTAPPCDHRYIIVGDIHGCPAQLEELMAKVNYQQGKDCLILAGDLVNKGPDSIGAVRLAQKLGAIGVLGNHDYTLLNCIVRCRKQRQTVQEEQDPVMQLASSFPQGCEDYLRSLPHMLRIPKYNVLVVHAGLNVSYPIDSQDVYEIMHMRRLELLSNSGTGTSSSNNNNNSNSNVGGDDKRTRGKARWRAVVKGNRGDPWGEVWGGPELVVFGHDARAGLQQHRLAYGIDTGCVYGRELTCLVFGPADPAGTLVSVPGLPKYTNERQGLPPPAAPVYEHYADELAKLILRPTTRSVATPSGANGSRPVFLATPLNAAAASALPNNNNNTTGPAAEDGAASGLYAVERATLLSLIKTNELRAVKTLMSLPAYETAWLSLLDNRDEDYTGSFWIPLVQGILEGLLGHPTQSTPDYADDVLQLALEVCDELEAVRQVVTTQLQTLADREASGSFSLTKATAKFLRLVAVL